MEEKKRTRTEEEKNRVRNNRGRKG